MSYPSINYMGFCSKNSVWSYIACLFQRSCIKITIFNSDSVAIANVLAGDLAKNDIIPLKTGQNKGWSFLKSR